MVRDRVARGDGSRGTVRVRLRDVVVAVFAGSVALAILAGGGFGDTPAGARGLDPPGAALVSASVLPLLVRRSWPLAAYAAASVATLSLFALHYPMDVPVAPVVAVYTLGGVYGGSGRLRRLTAVAAVAAFVPAMLLVFAAAGADPRAILMPEMAVWALFLAGVWIAGDRARLRRERIAALEERADRAEREAERERRVAAAEERLRVARELHDSAGHAVNVILVQAGAARLLREREPEAAHRAITTIEQVARTTAGEIDRLVRVLRDAPAADPAPPQPHRIEDLVEHHRAGGLRVSAEVTGGHREVPETVAWATYRILQEALTNAARHGGGSAHMAVRFLPEVVEITVTNPVATTPSGTGGGHGIVGMRERAGLVGGDLQAGPADRGGFRLHTRLPHHTGAAVG